MLRIVAVGILALCALTETCEGFSTPLRVYWPTSNKCNKLGLPRVMGYFSRTGRKKEARFAFTMNMADGNVPIWEAADALTLEDAMKVNTKDHASECNALEFSSAYHSPAESQKAVGLPTLWMNDITSIPFHVGPHSNAVFRSTSALLTPEECKAVIEEAERIASTRTDGWTTTRHANYPTTDIPVHDLPKARVWFKTTLQQRIFPFLSKAYPTLVPDPRDLRIFDVFVVKYDASEGGQRKLSNHRDGSLLSLNIALNDEFEGGGTWIEPLGDAVKQCRGGLLTHASSVLHGGREITSGVRYILVGFMISTRHVEHMRRFMDRGSAMLHEGMFAGSRRAYSMARQVVKLRQVGTDDSLYAANLFPFEDAVRDAELRLSRVQHACRERAKLLGLLYAHVGCMLVSSGAAARKGANYLHMAYAVLEHDSEGDRQVEAQALALRAWAHWKEGNAEKAIETLVKASQTPGAGVQVCEAARLAADMQLEAIESMSAAWMKALNSKIEAMLVGDIKCLQPVSGPEDTLLRSRLRNILCERGALFAFEGDTQASVSCFQAAVCADPTDPMAAAALQMAREELEKSLCSA